jgi:cyclic pyranopterin phosphate synthase
VRSRLPIICTDTDLPVSSVADAAVGDPRVLAGRGVAGYPGWLADPQGRHLRYLRLSVTDRCDLRCVYCMPESGVSASPREDVLSFEELVRVVRLFTRLGVRTVRLTGGEPLVRKDVTELVRLLRDEVGLTDLAMTTNGTALAHHARALVAAGLARINVSLDTVDPMRFARMTRGGDLQRVLGGIEAVLEAGIGEVKVNAVVVRGENDGPAMAELVEWAWSRGITPRFIELMPLGEGAKLGRDAVVSVAEIQAQLRALLALDDAPEYRIDRGPAAYLRSRDGHGKEVGFIGAVTDNFCHRCNRVRLTARGELRACLASPEGFSLRDRLRDGGDDAELLAAIEDALFGKREGHEFYRPGVDRHHAVLMSRIGG